MKNLSLHILDIVQNSIRAQSTEIEVNIHQTEELFTIIIADNGLGISEETLLHVKDPFYTSRTTRKVGLGLSLFETNAERTGGNLKISSQLGKGTVVTATFYRQNIDCLPLGPIFEVIALMISGNPTINFKFHYQIDNEIFDVQTSQLEEILGEISLTSPEVVIFLREMIKENLVALGVDFG